MREPKHDGSEWITWTDPETGEPRFTIPSRHKTLAEVAAVVVPPGVGWRVTKAQPHGRSPMTYEPRADLAAPAPQAVHAPQAVPADTGLARLSGYMAYAVYAILCGAKAGDLRWHGGAADFEIGGRKMDAQELLAYGRETLNGG